MTENTMQRVDVRNFVYVPPEDVPGIDSPAFARYLFDPFKDIPPQPYALYLNGVGFLPLGDVTTITGSPKSGKSTLLSILVGALVKGEFQGLTTEDKKPRAVLWIDTEQNEYTINRLYERICVWGGVTKDYLNDRFHVLTTRMADWQDKRLAVESALAYFEPDVIIIDGGADFLTENNEAQSQDFFLWLGELRKRYNDRTNIIQVIHLNKTVDASGSRTPRGFIGSEAQRKSGDVYELMRAEGGSTTTVVQRLTRNEVLPPFSFSLQETETGTTVEVRAEDSGDFDPEEYNELDTLLATAFQDGRKDMSAKEIQERTPSWQGFKDRTLRRKIETAVRYRLLARTERTRRGSTPRYAYTGFDIPFKEDTK